MTNTEINKAFEILARENTRMLMTYLRAFVSDDASVDDLYQETMIIAWKKLDTCDQTRPFGPWLRGIAKKLILAHYRKRSQALHFLNEQTQQRIDKQFQTINNQTGDTWDSKVDTLNHCLNELPDNLRIVIQSKYLDGNQTKHLAKQLSLSIEACKKRLQRARAKLAICLKSKNTLFAGNNNE